MELVKKGQQVVNIIEEFEKLNLGEITKDESLLLQEKNIKIQLRDLRNSINLNLFHGKA